MAVADYFHRNAVAISQAISGLDENRLAHVLGKVCIGVTIGSDANNYEGRAMLDLLVRMVARLYPTIVFRSDSDNELTAAAESLASRINPQIDLSGTPTVEIVLGSTQAEPYVSHRIYGGSRDWDAFVSTHRPHALGDSNNPFGAGTAACLVAATLFRKVFLSEAQLVDDLHLTVPNYPLSSHPSTPIDGDLGDIVLAGGGAIGNAVAWALQRISMTGSISLIDHEAIDLGNLQRYVMAEREDVGKPKATFLANKFSGVLKAKSHECKVAVYIQEQQYRVDKLLLALDSKRDRCHAQASLPRWIANAWTQPGDLGLSTHDFLRGACVQCLYLPDGPTKNEDQIVSETLGLTEQSELMQVRGLLHSNTGTPIELLEAIANARNVPIDRLRPFLGRPLRILYSEGFCGGAVIPLDQIGLPPSDLHVPLVHQSALAGILLAAAAVQEAHNGISGKSLMVQYDVGRPQPEFQVHPSAKDKRGVCICQDKDYQLAYKGKYLQ